MMARRIAFVVENALGHATHLASLQHFAAADARIAPGWLPIAPRASDLAGLIPGLPYSVRQGLRARQAIVREHRRQKFDCLYLHTQALAVLARDLMSSIPTVISLDATPENFRTIAPAYAAEIAGGWIGAIKHARFRQVFGLARGLVAWSEWARDSLIGDYGVPGERILVWRSGVDLRRWPAKSSYSAPGTPLRLLFVGGDFARKGGRRLLEVAGGRLAGLCELDIVTHDDPDARAPNVRVHRGLTPNSPALQRLYAAADVFVLPSEGDATPFAILEAMASALPVVTTSVGAVPELVRHGVSGLLLPPGDEAALADALRGLAADRGRVAAMGSAARADAVARFDAARNYRELLDYLANA